MRDTAPFAPFYKVTVTGSQVGALYPSITVAATSASTSSSAFPGSIPNAACQLQIANQATTAWAYVNLGIFGALTTAIVGTSFPVPPNSSRVITVDPEVNGATVVLSAGSGNVTFTRGAGV